MDVFPDEVYRLWKAYTTVAEMLRDRKYNIDDTYFMSYDEFREKMGVEDDPEMRISDLRKSMYYVLSGTKPLSVFWKEEIGISDVKEMCDIMKNDDTKHSIVVHNNKITPYATAALRQLKVQKILFEVFVESELQYNITKHEDVPRHIICSSKTKEAVFKTYNIDETKTVKILTTDPVIRYLGATKGQLIKIIRPSDSIPEVEVQTKDGTKDKKKLYDITYKIVS